MAVNSFDKPTAVALVQSQATVNGNYLKTAMGADKAEIITTYGDAATEKFNALGIALFGKIAQYNKT
jgi:hypothetical protein